MKRAQLVQKVLAACYCRLEPSPIHGIGVFAVRSIPRWTNPFGLLPKYARPAAMRVAAHELDDLPVKLADTLRALFVPTDGEMYIPTSGLNIVHLTAYLNHSTQPNLRTIDGFNFFTRRRIREGEELTVDYRTYGAETTLG